MHSILTNNSRDTHKFSWMVKEAQFDDEYKHISDHLRQGDKLMAVSDGSFHLYIKVGTLIWIIKPEGRYRATHGDNIVPG